MNAKRNGLGRGLEAIFDIEEMNVGPKTKRENDSIRELDIVKIIPNPKQPRTMFDDEALAELAESIKKLGIIQPITVKKEDNGTFTIISGERRYRASKLAGLTSVPVYIRDADDQTILEMALVENIQREDLNAVEIAISLQRLIEECNLTQDSLADRVGKKRSTITNYIRLLKLPAEVQLAVKEELITMGHARALLGLESDAQKMTLLKRTIKQHLSVRQVEELVKAAGQAKPKSEQAEEEYPESYTRLVEYLEPYLGQEISVKKSAKGDGKIVIRFSSDDEINSIIRKFESLKR